MVGDKIAVKKYLDNLLKSIVTCRSDDIEYSFRRIFILSQNKDTVEMLMSKKSIAYKILGETDGIVELIFLVCRGKKIHDKFEAFYKLIDDYTIYGNAAIQERAITNFIYRTAKKEDISDFPSISSVTYTYFIIESDNERVISDICEMNLGYKLMFHKIDAQNSELKIGSLSYFMIEDDWFRTKQNFTSYEISILLKKNKINYYKICDRKGAIRFDESELKNDYRARTNIAFEEHIARVEALMKADNLFTGSDSISQNIGYIGKIDLDVALNLWESFIHNFSNHRLFENNMNAILQELLRNTQISKLSISLISRSIIKDQLFSKMKIFNQSRIISYFIANNEFIYADELLRMVVSNDYNMLSHAKDKRWALSIGLLIRQIIAESGNKMGDDAKEFIMSWTYSIENNEEKNIAILSTLPLLSTTEQKKKAFWESYNTNSKTLYHDYDEISHIIGQATTINQGFAFDIWEHLLESYGIETINRSDSFDNLKMYVGEYGVVKTTSLILYTLNNNYNINYYDILMEIQKRTTLRNAILRANPNYSEYIARMIADCLNNNDIMLANAMISEWLLYISDYNDENDKIIRPIKIERFIEIIISLITVQSEDVINLMVQIVEAVDNELEKAHLKMCLLQISSVSISYKWIIIDNFETLKDKRNPVFTNNLYTGVYVAIIKMGYIDMEIAFEMWDYVLSNNQDLVMFNSDGVMDLGKYKGVVTYVLRGFIQEHDINDICKYIALNKNVLFLIFEKSGYLIKEHFQLIANWIALKKHRKSPHLHFLQQETETA